MAKTSETDTEKIQKAGVLKSILIFLLNPLRLGILCISFLLLVLLLLLFGQTVQGILGDGEVQEKIISIEKKVGDIEKRLDKQDERFDKITEILINGYKKE
jgi:hypothetical protein